MSTKLKMILIERFVAMMMCLVGYVLLFSIDWKLFLGVFLIHWGLNITNQTKYGKE